MAVLSLFFTFWPKPIIFLNWSPVTLNTLKQQQKRLHRLWNQFNQTTPPNEHTHITHTMVIHRTEGMQVIWNNDVLAARYEVITTQLLSERDSAIKTTVSRNQIKREDNFNCTVVWYKRLICHFLWETQRSDVRQINIAQIQTTEQCYTPTWTHRHTKMASPWCLWSSLTAHLNSTAVLQPAHGGDGGGGGSTNTSSTTNKRKRRQKKEKCMTEITTQDKTK